MRGGVDPRSVGEKRQKLGQEIITRSDSVYRRPSTSLRPNFLLIKAIIFLIYAFQSDQQRSRYKTTLIENVWVRPEQDTADCLSGKERESKKKMKEGTRYHLFVFLLFFPKLVFVPHFLLDDK